MNKFELILDDKIVFGATTLYRVRALVDFYDVKSGDLGGYIESKINLSHCGDAWVYSNARVSGDAQVSGNARVSGDARVSGNARVSGDARVYGNARVSDNAEIVWFSKVGSENGTLTAYMSTEGISVTRGCFSGTLSEFESAVAERHGGTQTQQEYVLLIQFIHLRLDKFVKPDEVKCVN